MDSIIFRKINLLALMLFFLISSVHAANRTQVISLKKGWNAVFLEVDPAISEQNLSTFIFGQAGVTDAIPIQIITTYLPTETSVEYIDSPDEEVWKKPSWNSWIRDDQPGAFLTNLYDLEAGQAYLIKSSRDFEWSVTGAVRKIDTKWKPGSFNLVGFQVEENAASFHQLFQESSTAEALRQGPIYSLIKGVWERVSLPDLAVSKNTSYWAFSDGNTAFQGNVELGLEGGEKVMNFLDTVEAKTVSLNNTTPSEKTVTLSLEDNEVPLSLVGKDEFFENTYTPVADLVQTITVPANTETLVKLAIRRGDITTAGEKTGVLKMVVAETQEVQRLPISAYGDQQ